MRLWQFRRSPYNEKARWALDLSGVAYERHTVVPGPHAFTLLVRTGNTLTPALERSGRVVVGSHAIVEALATEGESTLLPSGDRERIGELERTLDERFIPRMRRAVLSALLASPEAWHETFAADLEPGPAGRYRTMLGLFEPVIRWKNGMSAAGVADGRRSVREALDLVGGWLGSRRFLAGSALTLADVTAAASVAMVVPIDHPEVSYGPLARAALAPLADSIGGHEVVAWARELYRNERPRHRGT